MIVFIRFGGKVIDDVDRYENRRLEIHAEGHASLALAECHDLASYLLHLHGPWHFTEIQCVSPMERGLGDNRDSAWIVKAWAQVKS